MSDAAPEHTTLPAIITEENGTLVIGTIVTNEPATYRVHLVQDATGEWHAIYEKIATSGITSQSCELRLSTEGTSSP